MTTVEALRLERDEARAVVDLDRRSRRVGAILAVIGAIELHVGIVAGVLDGLLVPIDTLEPLPSVAGVMGGLVCIMGVLVYLTFVVDSSVARHAQALRTVERRLTETEEREM